MLLLIEKSAQMWYNKNYYRKERIEFMKINEFRDKIKPRNSLEVKYQEMKEKEDAMSSF